MSRSSTILLVLTALIAVVVYFELRLVRPEPLPPTEDSAAIRDLTARLEALETAARRPGGPLVVEEPDGPAGPSEPGTMPAPAATEPGEKPPSTPAMRDVKAKRVKEILALVEAGSLDRDSLNDLWDTLAGSGVENAAIEAFRAHVAAHPGDADGHYGLGIALTQKFLGGATSQLEVMKLSVQADRAFSTALEIDDDHFEARFSKAISYTFYPAIAGKGPEAIKHFEVLVQRHGSDGSNPMVKDVYFNLGNEYRKAGNLEKARATYRQGLGVFPDSRQIRTALEAMD